MQRANHLLETGDVTCGRAAERRCPGRNVIVGACHVSLAVDRIDLSLFTARGVSVG